jgi:hypothetical protein
MPMNALAVRVTVLLDQPEGTNRSMILVLAQWHCSGNAGGGSSGSSRLENSEATSTSSSLVAIFGANTR